MFTFKWLPWHAVAIVGLVWSKDRRVRLLVALIMVQLCFILGCGGDWMPGARFLVPVLPLLVVVWIAGASQATEVITSVGRPIRLALIGLVACVLLAGWLLAPVQMWQTTPPSIHSWAASGFATDYWGIHLHSEPDDYPRVQQKVARRIRELTRPGDLVAFGEMGIVPFTCEDIKFLDIFGLVDSTVSRLPMPHGPTGVQAPFSSVRFRQYAGERHPVLIAYFVGNLRPATPLPGYRLVDIITGDLQWGNRGVAIWQHTSLVGRSRRRVEGLAGRNTSGTNSQFSLCCEAGGGRRR